MTDFYNAFVACVYYGIDPANATVLIVDGHPKGSLDGIWSTLFGRVVRIGELKSLQVVDDLIWVMMSYDAPLHQHNRPSLPLHEPFRRFFLSRHGLPFADTVGARRRLRWLAATAPACACCLSGAATTWRIRGIRTAALYEKSLTRSSCWLRLRPRFLNCICACPARHWRIWTLDSS
ncbi:hypothetical protein BOX15_Mlig012739g2 [Macrostomum lignano]|uniref:Uncharacterized protein n=1 Tax=Macrostomum lignano TaxID=282301 RepID=A0A267EMT4_9PLAT|nr:hypothetical protein BOX15_Mlig012739g2 [Macrostomum lignano]